jgi:hypothetical protein
MKTQTMFTLAIASLLAIGIPHHEQAALIAEESGAQQPVAMKRGRGRIQDRVPAGGSSVVIEDDTSSPPLFVAPPPGMSEIEWLLQLGAEAFVIEVESAQARLNEREDWILTDNVGRVVQVFRAMGTTHLAIGDRVKWTSSGGQLRVRETTVTAKVSGVRSFVPGEKYLVFANTTGESPREMGLFPTTYRILPDMTLQPTLVRGPRDNVGGRHVSDIETEVRAWVTRRGGR